MFYYDVMNSESDFAKSLVEIIREEGYSVANDNERSKEMYGEFVKEFPHLDERFRNARWLTTEYPFFEDEIEIDGNVYRAKDLIYEFLQKQGYNMDNLVKEFIRRIASYDFEQESHKVSRDLKAYDFIIEDVFVAEDGLITVKTKVGESFRFYQADKYFSEDTDLGKYVMSNHGKNNCHDYTESLQSYLPDAVSVTAQLAREFDGNYYMHSYVELNENQVLDLNFNMVMNKDDFEKLMKPKKKCFICKNKEIKQKIEMLDEMILLDEKGESFNQISYYNMLKLAAFEILKERDPQLVSLYEEKLFQPS